MDLGLVASKRIQTARGPGRPVTLPGPLGVLARAAGGTAALAGRVGVNPRTLQRWARGAHGPSKASRLLLATLARELGLSHADQAALARLHARRAARHSRGAMD